MPNVSFSLSLTARNYDRVRAAISRMSEYEWYRGIIRDTAHEVLGEWARYSKGIVHKLTGHLAEAITWDYDSGRSEGHVYISNRIVFRRGQSSLQWPYMYGPHEHNRGGDHAFFDRTMRDKGHLAESVGMRALTRGVPPA